MGCDVWIVWDGMTAEDRAAQDSFGGCICAGGHTGTLRGHHNHPMGNDAESAEEEKVPIHEWPERVASAAARFAKDHPDIPEDHETARKNLEAFAALYIRLEAEGKDPRVLLSY